MFPDGKDVINYLNRTETHALQVMNIRLGRLAEKLSTVSGRLAFNLRKGHLEPLQTKLENTASKISETMRYTINASQSRLDAATSALNIASPLNILSKGYSVARKIDGPALKSAAELKSKDKITVEFIDGIASASVSKVTLR